jgi:hypothetical protein
MRVPQAANTRATMLPRQAVLPVTVEIPRATSALAMPLFL